MTQRSEYSFNKAAQSPTPDTPHKKKRPAPLSVRVSDAEREWISKKAGKQSVNAFVRDRIFADRPASKTGANEKDIARLLSELGRSRIAASLRTLAESASIGALVLDEELDEELRLALKAVSEIRDAVLKALRS